MRISVDVDGYALMDTNLDSIAIVNPKTEQEVNKAGKFTFTIYPDHPHYGLINRMKSIITVKEEGIDEPLFRGRVFDDKEGFLNEKQVTCEGELAFLNDSYQRPYTFTGSVEELFRQYIDNHNARVDAKRQFTVGIVTVTDPNDYITRSNSEAVKTWEEINNKLIKLLGGYLWTRHEGDITYIDYLADFNVLSNQPIEFGKNLLDLSKQVKADKFATAIVPYGARLKDAEGNDTDERLTIVDVNNGVDFVYNAEAVAIHGYIETTNTWDDVTDATNLKRKAQEYIDNLAQFTASINVVAADLNGATINSEPVNVNSFRIGRYVKVETKPHGLNQNFIVSKLTRELLKPENTKLTLGATYKSLTEKQKEILFNAVKGEKGDKGDKGERGLQGLQGEQGIQGEKGADGLTPYFHIKYSANASGNPMTETPNTYIGTYVDYTEADSTDYTKYIWARFQGVQGEKGDQGIAGVNGANGQTSYLHIAYATSADGSTGFSVSDSTNKTYIGQYTDFTSADSTDYTKYKWTKIKGEAGPKGDKGETGADGKDAAVQSETAPTDTSYMWLDISVEPPLLKRWNGTEWVTVNDQSIAITMLEQRYTADIQSTEQAITEKLTSGYYTKADTDALVSEVSTEWKQTAEGFEMNFSNIEKNLDDVANSADVRFQEISSYIRYEDGNIILGRSDSPLILRIENDRIAFIQNNSEVAYFSDNKLFVTDGEFINSIKIGNFAYIPRNNGNLSFNKIT